MKIKLHSSFLFLLFLGLKLTGYIAWSWIWVTAPLWIPLSVTVVFFTCVGIALCVDAVSVYEKEKDVKKR